MNAMMYGTLPANSFLKCLFSKEFGSLTHGYTMEFDFTNFAEIDVAHQASLDLFTIPFHPRQGLLLRIIIFICVLVITILTMFSSHW